MFSKKEKIVISILVVVFLISLGVVVSKVNQAVSYIDQRGLKSVVNDVWNGKQP